jgi:hypothetical protein
MGCGNTNGGGSLLLVEVAVVAVAASTVEVDVVLQATVAAEAGRGVLLALQDASFVAAAAAAAVVVVEDASAAAMVLAALVRRTQHRCILVFSLALRQREGGVRWRLVCRAIMPKQAEVEMNDE